MLFTSIDGNEPFYKTNWNDNDYMKSLAPFFPLSFAGTDGHRQREDEID